MKTLSLDRSLLRDGSDSFTLKDVIASTPEEFPTCSTNVKVKIPQARRSIEINQDVTDALRARYGSMPLGRALRIMLGLKPKVAQNGYQEEEDNLIRKYYPNYGAPPISKVLDRSVACIRERAAKLGIRRVWLYKRDRRCYNAVRRERAARARNN